MNCLLCNSQATLEFQSNDRLYFKCNTCLAISMHPDFFPTREEEINRYKTHNNDVDDLGYQNFVMPIVTEVLLHFNENQKGLDFGCGTGPVISKLLRNSNYTITTYDPLFDNNAEALTSEYNYIVCCEVIEHFHNPWKEFQLLKAMLKSNGKLFCMTHLYDEKTDFNNWYYKNDETHVIFYHKKTFNWIAKKLKFSNVTVNNRLISFSN